MSKHFPGNIITSAAVAAILISSAAGPAWAARDDRDRERDKSYKKEQKEDRRAPARPQPKVFKRDDRRRTTPSKVIRRDDRNRRPPPARPSRDYVLDKRYEHNRYYPPSGHRIPKLPGSYRVLRHHNKRYYYSSGIWYLYTGVYFVVTVPPVGIVVPILPPYYTTVWVGGVPYYYANGVYYVWHPVQRVYIVTDPPPATSVSEEPTEPKKLFIYPKKGQSADQQAKDRYACHAWAVEQTGFDPTRAGGNVAVEQYVARRDDYHRAMKACLEARGYSVK